MATEIYNYETGWKSNNDVEKSKVFKIMENQFIKKHFEFKDISQIHSGLHGMIINFHNMKGHFPIIHRMDKEIFDGLQSIEGFRWVEIDTNEESSTLTIGV